MNTTSLSLYFRGTRGNPVFVGRKLVQRKHPKGAITPFDFEEFQVAPVFFEDTILMPPTAHPCQTLQATKTDNINIVLK